MPGGQEAQRPDDRSAAQDQTAAPPPLQDELSSDTLNQVVAETTTSLARPLEDDPTLKAAMLEVVQRLAGQPMTLDPAGTALIEAVLRVQFPLLATRPVLLARTSRRVAESLLADPTARLRVEHLWATLAEDAA